MPPRPTLTAEVVNLDQLRAHCRQCAMAPVCLPDGMSAEELRQLDALVQRRVRLTRSQTLFEPEQPQRAIYAVRDGWMKSYRIDRDGNEHVLGFHMPGDLVGLDALARGHHPCFAQPVSTSAQLCEVAVGDLDDYCQRVPALRRQLMRLLSRDLNELEALHCRAHADQALAGFLSDLSERRRARGEDPLQLELVMTRREIASYLRLTPETVSRVLRQLVDAGLLEVKGRRVRLLDPVGLSRLLGD